MMMMGFLVLDGLMMGMCCGVLDLGVLFYFMEIEGLDVYEVG